MSRRSRRDEIGFGSDSFLDIIANIVGILIILIVIAGVRVSQAPVLSKEVDSASPVESESDLVDVAPVLMTEEDATFPMPLPDEIPAAVEPEIEVANIPPRVIEPDA